MTDTACISLSAWVLLALGACLFAGMFVGVSLRFGIDRAELAAYRRLGRVQTAEQELVAAWKADTMRDQRVGGDGG